MLNKHVGQSEAWGFPLMMWKGNPLFRAVAANTTWHEFLLRIFVFFGVLSHLSGFMVRLSRSSLLLIVCLTVWLAQTLWVKCWTTCRRFKKEQQSRLNLIRCSVLQRTFSQRWSAMSEVNVLMMIGELPLEVFQQVSITLASHYWATNGHLKTNQKICKTEPEM